MIKNPIFLLVRYKLLFCQKYVWKINEDYKFNLTGERSRMNKDYKFKLTGVTSRCCDFKDIDMKTSIHDVLCKLNSFSSHWVWTNFYPADHESCFELFLLSFLEEETIYKKTRV